MDVYQKQLIHKVKKSHWKKNLKTRFSSFRKINETRATSRVSSGSLHIINRHVPVILIRYKKKMIWTLISDTLTCTYQTYRLKEIQQQWDYVKRTEAWNSARSIWNFVFLGKSCVLDALSMLCLKEKINKWLLQTFLQYLEGNR